MSEPTPIYRTIPFLVKADETGQLMCHYEHCPVCHGRLTVKVYTASFETWSMEEKTCQVCAYFEKHIYSPLKEGEGNTRLS